jgi:UDP-hydrolysing UDP-N-acetyl-D-glucosamine 2-epimerase
MHVRPEFGNTIEKIKTDGFNPIKVDMDLRGDRDVDMAHATASVTSGVADALSAAKPDILVLLGDRYEILAAAQAALCLKIPVAHIHGGELTEGNIDESMRHAITKMAHVHFVAADAFKQRVMQLGENPAHVHTVGAVGLEHQFRTDVPSKLDLEKSIGMTLRDMSLMVTYHPVTLDNTDPAAKARDLCAALDQFPQASIILTGSNADAGGQRMMDVYKDYAKKHASRVIFVTTLGPANYLSALQNVSAVIGNSSSGLIEAPSAGVPTVNIGDRQKGRLQPPSAISCADDTASIAAAIAKALSAESKTLAAKRQNPYFVSQRPSEKIAAILKSVDLKNLTRKPFFDHA